MNRREAIRRERISLQRWHNSGNDVTTIPKADDSEP